MGLLEDLFEKLSRIEKQNELILENQMKLEKVVDPKPEEYLDIQAAAALLNLTVMTMYKKNVPRIKLGGKLMFRRSDLYNYIESRV